MAPLTSRVFSVPTGSSMPLALAVFTCTRRLGSSGRTLRAAAIGWVIRVMLAPVSTILVYVVFKIWLRVPLPAGVLSF